MEILILVIASVKQINPCSYNSFVFLCILFIMTATLLTCAITRALLKSVGGRLFCHNYAVLKGCRRIKTQKSKAAFSVSSLL